MFRIFLYAFKRNRCGTECDEAGEGWTKRDVEEQGMDKSHQNETEEKSTSGAIEDLARSHGVGAEEVKSLYESVLSEMKQKAVITDFLTVLAARKVKELLRSKGLRNER